MKFAKHFSAALWIAVLLGILWALKIDAKLISLERDTQAKLSLAHHFDAAHNKELVAIYENALAACMNGVGFGTQRMFVMCYPEQVSR